MSDSQCKAESGSLISTPSQPGFAPAGWQPAIPPRAGTKTAWEKQPARGRAGRGEMSRGVRRRTDPHWDVPTCEGQLSKGRCEKRMPSNLLTVGARRRAAFACRGLARPMRRRIRRRRRRRQRGRRRGRRRRGRGGGEGGGKKEALQPVQVVAPQRGTVSTRPASPPGATAPPHRAHR
jgi:hypothetical protein